MEVGSKMAIIKAEKQTGKDGNEFYKATVGELVYNSKKRLGGSWEFVMYQAYIMDTTYELEPAKFDLGVEKNKYSFKNISNPDTSIIRVFDFIYEEHFVWDNSGYNKIKNDDGRDKTKSIFYIRKLTVGNKPYKSPEAKITALQKELVLEKEKKENLRKQMFEIRRECKEKIKAVELKLLKANQFADKQMNKIEKVKNQVKEANKHTMVARRMNTINQNKLERVKNDLNDAKNEIKQVKKMRKEEIIDKAREMSFTFDDI